MVNYSVGEKSEMKLLIAQSATKALDLKIEHKNYDYEEIIPEVMKSIRTKNKLFGVLVVAAASKALKFYDKEKNYKKVVAQVLDESDNLILNLDEEVEAI
ncbi:MAG: hypothetical protein Q7S56_03855 [Nanoarchaeota archaeon]|nr:hypothetical protein [Nanoarchaeota archaeon]